MTVATEQNGAAGASCARLPVVFHRLTAMLPLLVSVLLLLAGLLLLGRRLAGAFVHGLPAPALWIAGIILAISSELLRQSLTAESVRATRSLAGDLRFEFTHWHFLFHQRVVPLRFIVGWLPIVGAWCVASGLSSADSTPLATGGLWACMLVSGVWGAAQQRLLLEQGGFFRIDEPVPGDSDSDAKGIAMLLEDPTQAKSPVADEEDHTPLPADVLQRIVRRQESEGDEWLSGLVRVPFSPGQRVAYAHVAFCPPFRTAPDCEAEPVDGPDAGLKVAQVLPQGARFEVKLAEVSAEPASVLIEFAAHWHPADS
jgi:hypothetical protein